MKIGDKVRMSREWLRNTGSYTGEVPHAKGTVTAIRAMGRASVAEVDWDTPEAPSRVLVGNLVKVGTWEPN